MTFTQELGELPHWELDSIFPGLESPSFIEAANALASDLDDLDKFLTESQIADSTLAQSANAVAAIVEGYLKRMSAATQRNYVLRMFVWCILDTDSSNELASRRLSELDRHQVRIRTQRTQFQDWIGRRKELLPAVLAESELARAHALYLREIAEQSHYLMSGAEETLAAELALSGMNAWSKLHGTIWSQLEVPFDRAGRVESVPMTMIQNIAWYDPDANVRQRAAEAEVSTWATMCEPLAAALNGVMGMKITLNKRRGRTDTLHAALDQARIDREILETLWGSIQDALPSLRQYLKAKAGTFGKQRLPWWDFFAPVGQMDRKFTFPQARSFIIEQFERFSPKLGAFAASSFEQKWIDAEPRAGKQGGAYCNGVPGTGISRILCNFDGSLTEVFTIAHELGHAFHAHCQAGKTPQQCDTPLTIAESASLFCETLVTDQALAKAATPGEELAILNAFLVTVTMNVVGTFSSYLFEKEAFQLRESAELSSSELCEISRKSNIAVYGEAADFENLHPYAWATIPHSFIADISFYNFPYAFGMLFSLGLYAQYQERGPSFISDFEALLASTGEATPLELAARFGIDLRERSFWQASLGLIDRRIERFTQLCNEHGSV